MYKIMIVVVIIGPWLIYRIIDQPRMVLIVSAGIDHFDDLINPTNKRHLKCDKNLT